MSFRDSCGVWPARWLAQPVARGEFARGVGRRSRPRPRIHISRRRVPAHPTRLTDSPAERPRLTPRAGGGVTNESGGQSRCELPRQLRRMARPLAGATRRTRRAPPWRLSTCWSAGRGGPGGQPSYRPAGCQHGRATAARPCRLARGMIRVQQACLPAGRLHALRADPSAGAVGEAPDRSTLFSFFRLPFAASMLYF